MRFLCSMVLIIVSLEGSAEINVNEAVTIGGIKQWINISGVREADPVLLFLHGGPGNSAMSYAHRFTNRLREHFVVVQWDQRESGATKKLNHSAEPLTVALFEQDAVEMINYLRSRFHQKKIYLMGHSWGGFLGMTVAARHAELLEAYLAVSPMIYQVESERLSLEWMKSLARKAGDTLEARELDLVKVPFETGEQLYYHRKWLAIHMSERPASLSYVLGWSKTWFGLFNEASRVNFFIEAPEIACPVYFFVGLKDYQTHYKLTEEYFRQVKARKKELFWFTESAHLVNLTEPGKMQEIIIKHILSKSSD